VAFPEASLSGPVTIRHTLLPNGIHRLTPDGLSFQSAVISLLAPTEPSLHQRAVVATLVNHRWEPLPTRTVSGRLLATLTHFSDYTVIIQSLVPGTADGFVVEHNGVVATLSSSRGILTLHTTATATVFAVRSSSTLQGSVTFSGLSSLGAWHWDWRGTHVHGQDSADQGQLTVPLPSSPEAFIVVQRNPGTLRVLEPGDCEAVLAGYLDGSTCRLTQDIQDSVDLAVAGMTLDCQGHAIRGQPSSPGDSALGLSLSMQPNMGVTRCNIQSHQYAIVSTSAHPLITHNNLAGDEYGAFLMALEPSQIMVTGNTITPREPQGLSATVGLLVHGTQPSSGHISGNHITGVRVGVYLVSTSVGLTVRDNLITVTQPPGSGWLAAGLTVVLHDGHHGPLVTQNTVESVGMGIITALAQPSSYVLPRVTRNNIVQLEPHEDYTYKSYLAGTTPQLPLTWELSENGEGNFWGRQSAPGFVPGLDSSGSPDATVVDSFPYCQPNAWLQHVPPCVESPPDSPTVTAPTSGVVWAASVDRVVGQANAPRVQVWSGDLQIAEGTVINAQFSMDLAVPLRQGTHTIHVFALGPALTSPPTSVTFSVTGHPLPVPVVTAPQQAQTIIGPRVLLAGTANPGASVVLDLAGFARFTAPVAADGHWSVDSGELSPGLHSLVARAVAGSSESANSETRSFAVAAGPTPTTPLRDRTGQILLSVVRPGETVVDLAKGQTSSTTYQVTFRSLSANSAHRIPVTLVEETYVLKDSGAPFLTLGGVIRHDALANAMETRTLTLSFDGRDRTGHPPTEDQVLTREVVAKTGYVTRSPAAHPEPISPLDPTWGELDISGLGRLGKPLVFEERRTVGPVPTGDILVRVNGDLLLTEEQCQDAFPAQLGSPDLGPQSRALPGLRFCCPKDGATTAAVQVDGFSGTRGLSWLVTPDQCAGQPDLGDAWRFPPPLCNKPPPYSPLGEACVTLVATNRIVHNNIPRQVGLCELTGLDLVPQDHHGGRFPKSALFSPGPITLEIRLASQERTQPPSRVLSASLADGWHPTPGLDSDGDGIRDVFDSCPDTPEELAGPSIDSSPGSVAWCGPAGGGMGKTNCVARGARDQDLNCLQDACDAQPCTLSGPPPASINVVGGILPAPCEPGRAVLRGSFPAGAYEIGVHGVFHTAILRAERVWDSTGMPHCVQSVGTLHSNVMAQPGWNDVVVRRLFPDTEEHLTSILVTAVVHTQEVEPNHLLVDRAAALRLTASPLGVASEVRFFRESGDLPAFAKSGSSAACGDSVSVAIAPGDFGTGRLQPGQYRVEVCYVTTPFGSPVSRCSPEKPLHQLPLLDVVDPSESVTPVLSVRGRPTALVGEARGNVDLVGQLGGTPYLDIHGPVVINDHTVIRLNGQPRVFESRNSRWAQVALDQRGEWTDLAVPGDLLVEVDNTALGGTVTRASMQVRCLGQNGVFNDHPHARPDGSPLDQQFENPNCLIGEDVDPNPVDLIASLSTDAVRFGRGQLGIEPQAHGPWIVMDQRDDGSTSLWIRFFSGHREDTCHVALVDGFPGGFQRVVESPGSAGTEVIRHGVDEHAYSSFIRHDVHVDGLEPGRFFRYAVACQHRGVVGRLDSPWFWIVKATRIRTPPLDSTKARIAQMNDLIAEGDWQLLHNCGIDPMKESCGPVRLPGPSRPDSLFWRG
jgi:hypothetical protein